MREFLYSLIISIVACAFIDLSFYYSVMYILVHIYPAELIPDIRIMIKWLLVLVDVYVCVSVFKYISD
jgi:hypothetical protein